MIRSVALCAALAILTGCSSLNKPKAPAQGSRPTGLVKLLDEPDSVYADLQTVSSYQGNPHLRRFYLISNYIKPHRVQDNPPLYVASSRVINVVNCDTQQRASFERIYLSAYWGQGEAIAKRDTVGQWMSYPKNSLIGIIADTVCGIKPERLKPEPQKDTRPTVLGTLAS